MDDLIRMTASDAVTALARGDASPLELIDAAEARIEATDGAVNALPTRCFDRARAHARRLGRFSQHEAPRGYLHGLPIAIKDLTPVAGVRCTMGSPIFSDFVPGQSDILVERLESRGALVIAKSNTPEFGAGAQTFNDVFGTTTNPWDTSKTPGGSSGGAAAALAAGQVWLAHGSDLGGSLRIPASFTGTVGLRPTAGRIARGPVTLPFDTLGVPGPMGRTVRDVALMLDAMAGEDPRDPISIPAPEVSFVDALSMPPARPRIAYSPDLGITPVDAEVARACRDAIARAGDFGGVVEAADVDFAGVRDMFQVLRAAFFAAGRAPLLEAHRASLKPEVVWNIEKGLALTAAEIGAAERARGTLVQRMSALFEHFDVLATPTVITPPFDHRIRYLEEMNGQRFETYIDWLVLTFAITPTGCPALSIPCGFSASGLPIGLQLVARPRNEGLLLAVAHLYERALGLAGRLPIEPTASDGSADNGAA